MEDRKILIGLLDALIDQGVPLETFRRDIEIRDKFFSTISEQPGINRTELKSQLADEFNLGYKSIEAIIYGNKAKVKVNEQDRMEGSC